MATPKSNGGNNGYHADGPVTRETPPYAPKAEVPSVPSGDPQGEILPATAGRNGLRAGSPSGEPHAGNHIDAGSEGLVPDPNRPVHDTATCERRNSDSSRGELESTRLGPQDFSQGWIGNFKYSLTSLLHEYSTPVPYFVREYMETVYHHSWGRAKPSASITRQQFKDGGTSTRAQVDARDIALEVRLLSNYQRGCTPNDAFPNGKAGVYTPETDLTKVRKGLEARVERLGQKKEKSALGRKFGSST